MLHCPVELYRDPLCIFMARYRTNCTFTSVPFSAGHSTVRSASTCAVPGFASRRAAQVSTITALCCMWSRPLGGARRRAVSEEVTAKHWNPSRYYAAIIMTKYDMIYDKIYYMVYDMIYNKIYDMVCDMIWCDIWYDVFVHCNCVDTWWQHYSTRLHTNSTQNDTMKQNTQNGTYIAITIHNLQIKQKHTKHTAIHTVTQNGTKWIWKNMIKATAI
jgi:hypothetical protein